MLMRVSRSGVAWLSVAVVALAGVALVSRAQDKPARPPGSSGGASQRADLDKARADVCAALEQFRAAEAKLREAERRLREMEGKPDPALRESRPREPGVELQIYRLKSTNAIEIAKVLHDVFGKERIVIVADPSSNSLIVRATEDDRITVAALLEQLDVEAIKPSKPGRKE